MTAKSNCLDQESLDSLRRLFKSPHDKLLLTANQSSEPNIALRGASNLQADETIDFEVSD